MAWSQFASPPAAFGVDGGILANASSGEAVAFGGVSAGVLVNSTLVYTEATNRWSALNPPTTPSPRSDFSIAFDPTTGNATLFGGLTNLTSLSVSNQTWTYHFGSDRWALSTATPAPPAREAAAFAIDPILGVGFLYGGWNQNYSTTGSLTYSDLWELDLSTGVWTSLNVPGPHPPPLEGASMVWDGQSGLFEMFGGCYPCGSTVWQLSPTSPRWSEMVTPSNAPVGRAGASWTYDPGLEADVLFGGTDSGTTFNDTQVFYPAHDSWVSQSLSLAPAARTDASSAYLDVSNNGSWLLAGGQSGAKSYSDLWRLSVTSNLSLQVVNASAPLSALSGVQVSVGGRRAGVTDALGFFNLTQVDGAGLALNFTDTPWFYPKNLTVWLTPGASVIKEIPLTPEPLGSLGVQVLSAAGPALPGVFVNLSVDAVPINTVPAVANASGNASFYGVPPGTAEITTEMLDWRSGSAQGVLAPGQVLNTTVVMYPDPVLIVSVFGSLPGGVFDPLTSAEVFVGGTLFGFTGPQGTIMNSTSTIGLVPLTAEAPGFFPGTGYASVPFTGLVTASLELQTRPFGFLPVTVLRSNDSFPIVRASVTATTVAPLAFGSYSAINLTDARGVTSLSLPVGNYTVSASAVGYITSTGVIVNVSTGSNLPVIIYLEPIPPATVQFIVRAASTGAPVAGANISATGVPTVHANAWGYYNVTNLTPGTYYFDVWAPGYLLNVTALTLYSNENLTQVVNLTLAPLVLVNGGGGWGFNLFPGGVDELWPFLLVPLLLVVGGFVFASVLRGMREGE